MFVCWISLLSHWYMLCPCPWSLVYLVLWISSVLSSVFCEVIWFSGILMSCSTLVFGRTQCTSSTTSWVFFSFLRNNRSRVHNTGMCLRVLKFWLLTISNKKFFVMLLHLFRAFTNCPIYTSQLRKIIDLDLDLLHFIDCILSV